jgi:hypothetical protein
MPSNSPAMVADSRGSAGAQTLRRLPARDAEPPFDDEVPAAITTTDAIQGTLALAFALPSGVPAIPSTPGPQGEGSARRLRLVPAIGHDPGTDLATSDGEEAARPAGRGSGRRRSRVLDAEEFGPQQTPRSLLPEPKPWAGRLVQAIVEVTAGVRPIGQLVRWTTTEVYDAVRSRGMAASRDAGPIGRTQRRLGAVVRSVHVNEPADGVAEVCAVVQQGARCRAIALRLEGIDGRWQCTALQVG